MSKDASKELQELEARLLSDKLIRRAKLLATMQKGTRISQWYNFAFFLPWIYATYTLVRQAFDHNAAFALFMIVCMLPAIISIYVMRVESRVDAIVKLLQEDGMLQGTPATPKHVAEP